MDFPLVSIVMPSFNQAQFLGAAMDSVLHQDYPNIELIVADGASTDDSVILLKQRQQQDQRLRWFSRQDNGPAHALNQALRLVRGTTIGWLNSDDVYANGAISRAVNALSLHPDWLMVYGHGQHINAQGELLTAYPTLPAHTAVQRFQQGCFICQPSMFFHRSAYLLLGALDEELKTAFDFEYWLRAFVAFHSRIGFIDDLQAFSRLHGDCITMRMRRKVILEGMQILARHLGFASKEWLLSYADETLRNATSDFDAKAYLEDLALMLQQAKPWLTTVEYHQLTSQLPQRLKR